MKLISLTCAVLLFGATLCLRLHAETPTASPVASHLSPIAFLTAHEWNANLPDSPDGKKVRIHAQFSWSQNRQAIRISNQLVVDGHPQPYIDGLYAWDPQRQAIAFWYIGAEGNVSKGTVKLEGGQLVHDFEELTADGKSSSYVAKVTPHGDTSWENEIFARRGSELTAIVKVRYEIADSAH